MQQRQLRLGDILDDYCPRERRVTNHAVVAMVDADVKQTRCTTCDTEHEYKHAKVPRQRRKTETPAALYSQVLASGPKRVAHEGAVGNGHDHPNGQPDESPEAVHENLDANAEHQESGNGAEMHAVAATEHSGESAQREGESIEALETDDESIESGESVEPEEGESIEPGERDEEDGPVHRPLIRASLPRPEGQPPPTRPIPEFTIRQPGGRPNRFRPRHGGGGQQGQFQGNRGNGNMGGGPPRGMRPGGGRPPQGGALSRMGRRHGPPGRKRSK
jgi:hypothetical protein